jgi:hypothetical protein
MKNQGKKPLMPRGIKAHVTCFAWGFLGFIPPQYLALEKIKSLLDNLNLKKG